MRVNLWPRRVFLGLVAFALCGGIAAYAGQSGFQQNFGSSFFIVDDPCPARQFPTFESLVPVPAIVDPFAEDIIVFCQFFADDDKGPKKGVKISYETDLIVIDNNTGEVMYAPIEQGRGRTKKNGVGSFDFELPTELFADGFESGDVSAWSYTRTNYKGTKKVQQGGVSCDTGSSSSSE